MRDWIKVSLIAVTFAVLSIPDFLFAATGHVKFEVVGQSSCTKETMSGATTLAIGQECPATNTIISIAGSNPTLDIDGLSDFSIDAWKMPTTLRITARQSISHLHLKFLREAQQLPQTGYYKTWIKGGVTGGAGVIIATGSVTRLSNPTVTLTLDPVTGSAANGSSFESSSIKQWTDGTLNVNRELLMDLEIVSLDNGATLDLSIGGGFIKIRSQATPDNEDPPVSCKESGNWFLTTTCATTHKMGYPANVVADNNDPIARAYEFAKNNWNNLSQDMARGTGENLTSFATLLTVPAEQQSIFFALAQEEYRQLKGTEGPEQVVASLQQAWNREHQSVN